MDILDDIDWIEFGYPDLGNTFRKLTSKKEESRNEVYDMLARHHLRAVTHISPYVVPYLIQLLSDPDVEGKDHIIALLMDWSFESRSAFKIESYKLFSTKLLIEIKKGLSFYQNIAENDYDEETRISARQLLNTIKVEM